MTLASRRAMDSIVADMPPTESEEFYTALGIGLQTVQSLALVEIAEVLTKGDDHWQSPHRRRTATLPGRHRDH